MANKATTKFVDPFEKLLDDKEINKYLVKDEKKVIKLGTSFEYWRYNLMERCMRIFEWSNLPFYQKELEMRVLTIGWTGFVNDDNVGYAVTRGDMYGVTEYFDEFTNFIYAGAVFKGGDCVIGKDATICNNTAMRTSILPMINRYASLLAHAEMSTKCAMVSLRKQEIFSVEDDETAENVRLYHNKIYEGEQDVILDKSLIGSIQNLSNSSSQNTAIMQAWDIRQEILRSFYNEIGVRYTRDKKERMVSDEATGDTQMLLLNINDMLKCRKEFCEETNKIFGLNISVKLSEEFELLYPQKEGEIDDNKEVY